MDQKREQTILLLALTAVFIGYLMVWLPGPSAGLQFLGVEMGEWTKFLGMDTRRNVFYLPPITLSTILLLLTLTWSPHRWQTWVWRGIAVAISLLAFPAWEDLRGTTSYEYTPRVLWIGLVILVAVVVSVVGWRWGKRPLLHKLSWLFIFLVSVAGALLPTWAYWQVKTAVEPLFGLAVGVGWGVWLNGVGQLLIAGFSLTQLVRLFSRQK